MVASLSPVLQRDAVYRLALEQSERLLQSGFTQEQLSALCDAVPDLFGRHKDWTPPLELGPDGSWREAPWFAKLESKLQPALSAASVVRQLGYY